MGMERGTSGPEAELDLMDWLRLNTRWLVIAGIVVVAAAGAYWLALKSRQLKALNAEKGLMTAQESIASKNNELAKSDLKKVVTRYSGTAAGTQAALLLAQLNYDEGKFKEGIDGLKGATEKAGSATPGVIGMIGDGQSMMGRNQDAAESYQKAADSSPYANEKSYYRAKAARSYAAAGKTDLARKVWTELAADQKAPSVAAEARVRLAELDAKPAGRS